MKSVVNADNGEIGDGEYLHPAPSRAGVSVGGILSSAQEQTSTSLAPASSAPDGNLKERILLHPTDVSLGRPRIEYNNTTDLVTSVSELCVLDNMKSVRNPQASESKASSTLICRKSKAPVRAL